jgi:hypothetical protein
MFSVVVIAYRRAALLRRIVDGIPSWVENIYIFVDGDPTNNALNEDCRKLSENFANENKKITIRLSEVNLGPGLSVPTAIEWALVASDTVLVLEDDCVPTDEAYVFFKNAYDNRLDNEIICGSSPFDFHGRESTVETVTRSHFALVSGWLVPKEVWQKLSILDRHTFSYMQLLKVALSERKKLLPLSFFYASIIRVRAGKIMAWDSSLCYSMLINNVKAVIPNITLVNNFGADDVASNTHPTAKCSTGVYQAASMQSASTEYDDSDRATAVCDRAFISNVYAMKVWHIFSPLKSWLAVR